MLSSLFGGKKDALEATELALKSIDWKYSRRDDRTIITGFKSGSIAVVIAIRNETDKRALLVMGNALMGVANPMTMLGSGELKLLRVHTAAGHSAQQVSKVCEYLLSRNYELAVGAFERDPSDGEIRFRIGLPYRDAPPTEEQMKWCLALTSDAMSQLLRDVADFVESSQGMEI
jgi:hypothetical protein